MSIAVHQIRASHQISGRPLIFMAMVLAAWTGTRLFLSFPPEAEAAPSALPHPAAMSVRTAHIPQSLPGKPPAFLSHRRMKSVAIHPALAPPLPATRWTTRNLDPPTTPPPAPLLPLSHLPDGTLPKPKRLQAAAWLYWRAPGDSAAFVPQGRLGGSQLGLRLDRDMSATPAGEVAAYARLTSALEQPHGAELALGASLRPRLPWPLSFGIERRIALDDHGRNAFALVAATGLRCTCGPADLILDGYAQGGMVGFARQHGFADARLSALHPLAASGLSAGLSISGGAQPRLARLDIGPMLEWRLPTRPMPSRLTIEWRERIGGKAAPGSGLAVTLATDF